MKVCKRCNQELDNDFFYKEYNSSVNICRKCTQKQRKIKRELLCEECSCKIIGNQNSKTCSEGCRNKRKIRMQNQRRGFERKPKEIKQEKIKLVKLCYICSAKLGFRQYKFCSKVCELSSKRIKNQTKYRDSRLAYFKKYNKENKESLKEYVKNNREHINKRQRKRRTGTEEYTTYEQRQVAIKKGFRSGFELTFSEWLDKNKFENNYEPKDKKIDWVDTKTHKYTPDWVFEKKDGSIMYVELKGLFSTKDREKILAIIKQHNIDIRMVFQHGKTKLYKGSKTTYIDWCIKHQIKFHDCKDKAPTLPEDWLKEIKK